MSPRKSFGSLKSEVEPVRPFLKWAGGKGQLLKKFKSLYPAELVDGKIMTYCEPCIGSGAVFFEIVQNYEIQDTVIIDVNKEIIVAYTTIQKNVEQLIIDLGILENSYLVLNKEKKKNFFNEKRREYNVSLPDFDFDNFGETWIRRTSLMIFLNKTCFNGLFRVNSKGEFNVPPGDQNNPTICNAKNLKAVSKVLQGTKIIAGDYTLSKEYANENSFFYFDPPYRPLSKSSSFTSYSTFSFTDAEQRRLAGFFNELNETGAKLMLSNSDPKNEDPKDDFFDELYSDFQIIRVPAKRSINSVANKRGQINEIVVTNY